MKERKDFINRESSFFPNPREFSADKRRENLCRLYSVKDYARYIGGAMSASETISFEKHAHDCPICQKGLAIEQDQRENEALLKKTYDLLNNLDKPRG